MLFVGCLLLGIGLGMLFDELAAGAVIGIGVAFILSGLADRLKPLIRRERGHDKV